MRDCESYIADSLLMILFSSHGRAPGVGVEKLLFGIEKMKSGSHS